MDTTKAIESKYNINNCPNCVCCTEDYECSDKDFETIDSPLEIKDCFKINPFAAAERYENIKFLSGLIDKPEYHLAPCSTMGDMIIGVIEEIRKITE